MACPTRKRKNERDTGPNGGRVSEALDRRPTDPNNKKSASKFCPPSIWFSINSWASKADEGHANNKLIYSTLYQHATVASCCLAASCLFAMLGILGPGQGPCKPWTSPLGPMPGKTIVRPADWLANKACLKQFVGCLPQGLPLATQCPKLTNLQAETLHP